MSELIISGNNVSAIFFAIYSSMISPNKKATSTFAHPTTIRRSVNQTTETITVCKANLTSSQLMERNSVFIIRSPQFSKFDPVNLDVSR